MRKLTAVFLVFVLLLSLAAPALAADSGLQYSYSSTSNSGKRHETCTTLLGTGAAKYYTGSYTYDNLSTLSKSSLLNSLRTLMKSTHTKNTSYNNCRDYATKTDCEQNNGKIVMLYSSYTATSSQYQSGQGWNREHVWPQSLGGFGTSGAGADMHHIRPAEAVINSTRNNRKDGNVTNGKNAVGNLSGLSGGTYGGNDLYEPLDEVKGDVARICLYIYVRYGGDISECSSITNVFQSVEVLLEWCELDPVDTWEMGRNEVVYAIQGNRNVFIDYPEYAWLIFGKEVPSDMVTPSGEAGGTAVCTHRNTQLRGQVNATCTTAGYTGDTWCVNCQICISTGTTIPATNHKNTVLQDQTDVSCTSPGYSGDLYCMDCGTTLSGGASIPATGHLHTALHNQTTAGCETPGYTGDLYCSDCRQYIATGIPISPTGHQNTKLLSQQAASCGKDGYTGDTYCMDCKKVVIKGETIPATGNHLYGAWTTVQQPTQSEPGLQERICFACDHRQTQQLPALEPPVCKHGNLQLTGQTDADCTDDGYTGDVYCADCGILIASGIVIPATGHLHTEIRDAAAATCGKEGYTGDTYCTDCNIKIADGETIPTTEHKNTELRDVVSSSCTTFGYSGDVWCVDCNTKIAVGQQIDATGHLHTEIRDAAAATCGKEGYTGDTYCTDCNTKIADGEAIATTEHLHTEIRGQKDATCVEAGSEGDTWCTDCNTRLHIGKLVEATGRHVYGPIAPGGEHQTYQECTVCGHRVVIDLEDERPGTDWMVIGIAATSVILAGGMVAMVIRKKKKA